MAPVFCCKFSSNMLKFNMYHKLPAPLITPYLRSLLKKMEFDDAILT